jgi:hypothetical protein
MARYISGKRESGKWKIEVKVKVESGMVLGSLEVLCECEDLGKQNIAWRRGDAPKQRHSVAALAPLPLPESSLQESSFHFPSFNDGDVVQLIDFQPEDCVVPYDPLRLDAFSDKGLQLVTGGCIE